MNPFRRVEDRRAGPQALGILVPPGQKTFVIVRPRALPWDLLPMWLEEQSGAGPQFASFGRDEAALLARRFQQTLEGSAAEHEALVETAASPWAEGHIVRISCLDLVWIACLRQSGKPYQAIVFTEAEEAQEAARQIARFLCPEPHGDQEYYFNTQHFSA